MNILKEQSSALNVVETLELLPDSTPMHILAPWLTESLQNAVHQSRHMTITTKLYQMENLRVKANNANLKQGTSRKVSHASTSKRRAAKSASDRDESGEVDVAKTQHQDEEDPTDESEDDMMGSLPRESTNDGDLMAGW